MSEEQKQLEQNTQEAVPRLYSKNVIWAFSILFSTIFGTVILMSNLKAINEKRGRLQVLLFGVVFTLGTAISIGANPATTNYSLFLNIIGALILNEYFWNRYIGKEALFEKKKWHKPAIISLLISLPFILAVLYAGNI